MNIKSKTKYILFIIPILAVIFAFLLFNNIESDAADSFSVLLSNPVWEYDEFTYSSVTVDTNSTYVKNISVYVENGSISSLPSGVDWHTDLDKGGTGLHKTAICSLPGLTNNTDEIIKIIKNIKFKLDSYNTQIKVTVIIDGHDTSLPSVNGYTVTRGADNHYYLFVPEILDWTEAYNAAKSLQFMGMKGYLVTITSAEEDRLLDNITTLGAWAGASRVPLSLPDSKFNQDTVWSEFGDADSQADLTQTGWKWVCGPESGSSIKITGSWSDVKDLIYDPNGDPSYSNSHYTGYSNWNRNTTDPDSAEFRGNEPNNFHAGADPLGEYCMSVHYHDNGEAGAGILGWNDLPNHSANDFETYISGYFVEFDGLDVTQPTTADIISPVDYPSHIWHYTPQLDGDGNIIKIKITCDEPSHNKCIYDDTVPHYSTLNIDCPDITYKAAPYDSSAVKLLRNGEVQDNSTLSVIGITPGSIQYSGTALDGTPYGPSTTAPKYAGSYTAQATFNCNGTNYTTTSDFQITQTTLTIKLDDQTVDIGQNISSTTADIKQITGLKGSDSVTDIDIIADTSTVGSHDITENSSNAANIVIKSGSADVTFNYDIVIEPGTATVKAMVPNLETGASASAITYGQTLQDSTITGTVTDPYTGTAITGTFTWDTPAIYPEVSDSNTTDYDATFTPNDSASYESIPLKLKLTVHPKDIASSDINRTISLNMNNIPSVELKDSQINNTTLTAADFSVSYVKEGKKIKVTITGKGNYTGSFSVYVNAHTWTGRIESDIVVDSSADKLSPSVSAFSQANGMKLLTEKLKNPANTAEQTAKDIVDDIKSTGNSTDGDFNALIQITVKDAQTSATAAEKSCAISTVGAPAAGQSLTVPASAAIGLYFDISMQIEYKVVDQTVTPATDLVNKTEAITDISDAAVTDGGFMETVRITVPDELRPAEGYTRTYYIIRVHDDGSGTLKADVLLLSRSGYNLTFKTDLFSVYALAYVETEDTPDDQPATPGKKPGKNPDKKDTTDKDGTGGSKDSTGKTGADKKGTSQQSTSKSDSSKENGTSTQVSAPRTGDAGYVFPGIVLLILGFCMLIAVCALESQKRKDNA